MRRLRTVHVGLSLELLSVVLAACVSTATGVKRRA
jgi:hypothetical protein